MPKRALVSAFIFVSLIIVTFGCRTRAQTAGFESSAPPGSLCMSNDLVDYLDDEGNPVIEQVDGSNFPQILRYKRPPSVKILKDPKLNPWFPQGSDPTLANSQVANIDIREWSSSNFNAFLDAIENGALDANYFFVGNGGYITYVIARGIFAGTKAEERFHAFLLSREAIRGNTDPNNRKRILEFFDAICIQKAKSPYIMVIDSLIYDSSPSAQNRSVVQLAVALRRFLNLTGLSERDAVMKVIPAGGTETNMTPQSARTDLESYFDDASKIPGSEEANQVFLELDPNFWRNFLERTYGYLTWPATNGKYERFDDLNLPTNFTNDFNLESELWYLNSQRESFIKKLTAIYLKALTFGRDNREKVQRIAQLMEDREQFTSGQKATATGGGDVRKLDSELSGESRSSKKRSSSEATSSQSGEREPQ